MFLTAVGHPLQRQLPLAISDRQLRQLTYYQAVADPEVASVQAAVKLVDLLEHLP